MNIYVGNLSYQVTEDDVRELFTSFGDVKSVNIITDKMTGNSKGFAFVEMPNSAEAQEAMKELDGKEIDGRQLRVNEAKPPQNRDRDRGPPRPRRQF